MGPGAKDAIDLAARIAEVVQTRLDSVDMAALRGERLVSIEHQNRNAEIHGSAFLVAKRTVRL